jgi:hypothetical protein
MDALSGVTRHQYWQEKDLVGALAFCRAGIQFGLQPALIQDQTQTQLAHQLRSGAKGFAYNFASFAWSGWDEPGVKITSADHAAGFDAARVNLSLAIELERGDLPISRAHWMVGAYCLAEGEYEKAIAEFEEGSACAEKAEAKTDELLNQAYILLAKLLGSPEDTRVKKAYEEIKESLLAVEHAEDFIQQLNTAYRVFSG